MARVGSVEVELRGRITDLEQKLAKARSDLAALGPAAQQGSRAAAAGLNELGTGAGRAARALDEVYRKLGSAGPAGEVASAALRSVSTSGFLAEAAAVAAGTALGGLAVKLAGAAANAAGAAISLRFLRENIDQADSINKLSQKIGIGVEDLTRFSFSAKLADQDLATFATGIGLFSRKLVEARSGSEEAQAIFRGLGVDFNQSTTPALYAVADAFAAMQDGEEKTAAAMGLFGRSGREMVPLLNAGADGLKRQALEASSLGLVLSKDTTQAAEDFNDSLHRISASAEGVGKSLTAHVLPVLASLAAGAASVAEDLNRVVRTGTTTPVSEADLEKARAEGRLPQKGRILTAADIAQQKREHLTDILGNVAPEGGFQLATGEKVIVGAEQASFNTPEGAAAFAADESRAKQAKITAAEKEQADKESAAAAKEAAAEQKRADAERMKQLEAQLRVQDQVFTLQQSAAKLEADTVAGAAKTRLEQAERGLNLEELTAEQRQQLLALAQQVDATDHARLQTQLALLEAERAHVAMSANAADRAKATGQAVTDQVEAQAKLDDELKQASLDRLDAQIAAARQNLELMPSAVDDLNRKLSESGGAVDELGKKFADIAGQFGGDLATAILTNQEDIGKSLKKALTAGIGRLVSDGLKELIGGAIGGLTGTGGAADVGANAIGQLIKSGASSVASSIFGDAAAPVASEAAGTAATAAIPSSTGAATAAAGAAGTATVAGGATASGLAGLAALPYLNAIRVGLKTQNVTAGTDPFKFSVDRPLPVGEAVSQATGKGALAVLPIVAVVVAALTAIVSGIANAVYRKPIAEGLVGAKLEDILNAAHIPITTSVRSGHIVSPFPYVEDRSRPDALDPYFPQVPLPASYASLNTDPTATLFASMIGPGLRGVPHRGSTEYATWMQPTQTFLNAAAGLGLNEEGAQTLLRSVTRAATGNFDQGVIELQKIRQNELFNAGIGIPGTGDESKSPFGADDPRGVKAFAKGVQALIESFTDNLLPAVDAAALSLRALDKDGQLALQALDRQIASAQTVAQGLNLGAAAQAGLQPGANAATFARTVRSNASTAAQGVIFDQIGQSAIGKSFGGFTTDIAAAAEAFRQGDTSKANDLIKQARADYAAATQGAEAYFDEIKKNAPELAAFIDDLERQNKALQNTADAAQAGANAIQIRLKGGTTEDAIKSYGEQVGQIFGQAIADELIKSELFTATLGPAIEKVRDYAHDLAIGDNEAAAADLAAVVSLFQTGGQALTDILTLAGPGLDQLGSILGLNGGSAGPSSASASPAPARTLRLPSFDGGGEVPGVAGSPQLIIAHGKERVYTRTGEERSLQLLESIDNHLREGRIVVIDNRIDAGEVARAVTQAQKYSRVGNFVRADARLGAG